MMTMRASWFMVAIGACGLALPAQVAAASSAAEDATMAVVEQALTASATIPDARVAISAVERGHGACAATVVARVEVPRPGDGSGRFAVKLIGPPVSGAPCETWSWVRLRLYAKVSVATRAIHSGEGFAGALATEEREIKPGHIPALVVDGATADRPLGAGQMLEADAMKIPGPRAGESVKVVLIAGGMAIEQTGRAVPCARNHTCAVLPSGKHVDGALVDGRLMVQLQ